MALTKVKFRMIDGDPVNVMDFGVDNTGTTDSTSAIQAAFDAAEDKTVYFPKGTYRFSSELTLKGSLLGQDAVLMAYGSQMSTGLNAGINQTKQGNIRGITIDGTNATSIQYAIFADFGIYEQTETNKYEVVIKNLSNSNNTQSCIGVLLYRSSTATINPNPRIWAKVQAYNITSTANGVIGDAAGAARGISVSFNSSAAPYLCNAHVVLEDCIVDNVTCGPTIPNEDADGIVLYYGAKNSLDAEGLYIVKGARVSGCKKRGIKVQSPNTIIENCYVDGDGCDAGYETYGVRTTFKDNKCMNSTGACFTSDERNTIFENCEGEQTATNRMMRLYATCDDALIKNCKMKSTATHVLDMPMLEIQTDADVFIDNLEIEVTTNTGTAIKVGTEMATKTLQIANSKLTGMERGLIFNLCEGVCRIWDTVIIVTNLGTFRVGNTAYPVYMDNIRLRVTGAGGIGIQAEHSGGASSHLVYLSNSLITANGNGILGADGSRFVNNIISSTGVTGYGIIASDSVYRDNRITGYDYALGYQYTTTAEVANNVSIGAGTGLALKTGYTPFVENDNYAR